MSPTPSPLFSQLPSGGFAAVGDDVVVACALSVLGSRLKEPQGYFSSPAAARSFLCLHLGSLPYEVFAVMFLDARNGLICFEQMFRGTLTQTSVYPREVVKRALELNCAAVVFSHPHPSGSVEPSRADEHLTGLLKSALALVDVRVLDHVIVSGDRSYSMAEHGLL